MARWWFFFFCLLLVSCLVDSINTMAIADERLVLARHIGSARENRFRAQQRPVNSLAQPPSADSLRARWTQLFNEKKTT